MAKIPKDVLYFGCLIIVVFAVVFLAGEQNITLDVPEFSFTGNLGDIPFEPEEDETYEAKIEVIPSYICVGDSTHGEVTTNMPNGVCRLWVNPNNNGWQHLMDFTLDSSGYFETSEQTINTVGYADFRGVCLLNGRYAITNTARLEVDTCGTTTTTTETTTTLAPGPYQGMPCSQVPAGTETCEQGACDFGTCTYMPPDLVTPARCECR